MNLKALLQPLPIGVAVVAVLTGAVVQSLPAETAKSLTSESGPFEIASAGFYGTAFVLAAIQLMRQPTSLRLAGAVMVLWAFMRELDFQRRFTYRSVESTAFFRQDIAPTSQKLLVLAILTPFVLAGLYLAWTLVRRLWPALQRGDKWPGRFAVCVLLGALSSTQEKLLHWGAAEEVCEAGLACCVLLLVWELRVRPPANNSAASSSTS